jgi:hypothetical protein
MYVYEERERISVTLVTTAAQGCASDICMCVRACVCAGIISLISLFCVFLSVGAQCDTKTHTHIQATLKTQAHTGQVMIAHQHFRSDFHSTTVSQYLATRNTHTH